MFSDIKLTNNTILEFHNHPKNSSHGWIHNDYHVANFADDPLYNGINLWKGNTNYRQKQDIPGEYITNVRSIALTYYMNPESYDWKEGDGGETGLFPSHQGEVDVSTCIRKIAPIPNRLAVYEINPYSWHAIMMKNKEERISVHQWYHSEYEYYRNKYSYSGISPMDGN